MKQAIPANVPEHDNAKVILEKELEARLAEFTQKRGRDKLKAFSLRIASVVFGALITVLVGLRVNLALNEMVTNVVLVLGALTVIANAWDSFYDHRGLWVKRTITVAHLKKVKRDLDFEVALRGSSDLAPGQLRALKGRLDQILEDDLNNWTQLRDEVKELKGRTEPMALLSEANGESHAEGGKTDAPS
ncbi:MAG: SLATT domain-containing protein [Byssovorax sp.]